MHREESMDYSPESNGLPVGGSDVNSWWWLPIGLATWFLVSLAVGLLVGPALRRASEPWDDPVAPVLRPTDPASRTPARRPGPLQLEAGLYEDPIRPLARLSAALRRPAAR